MKDKEIFFAIGSERSDWLLEHARHYSLMLAESQLTRRMFGRMVWRMDALAVAIGNGRAISAKS